MCLFVVTNTNLACGTSTSEGCETLELLQEEKEWQVSEVTPPQGLPAVGCLSGHYGWKTPKGWSYGHWNWLKGLSSPPGRFSSVSPAPHLCIFCLQRTESLLGGSEPPSVLPVFQGSWSDCWIDQDVLSGDPQHSVIKKKSHFKREVNSVQITKLV